MPKYRRALWQTRPHPTLWGYPMILTHTGRVAFELSILHKTVRRQPNIFIVAISPLSFFGSRRKCASLRMGAVIALAWTKWDRFSLKKFLSP